MYTVIAQLIPNLRTDFQTLVGIEIQKMVDFLHTVEMIF